MRMLEAPVVTDAQVRKLMKESVKGATIEVASMKAGMTRKTGSKYISRDLLPSERKSERNWRTRPDPFAEDWPRMEEMLIDAPELEAKALFEYLMRTTGRYQEGQLRTFQRRVRRWLGLYCLIPAPNTTGGPFHPRLHKRNPNLTTGHGPGIIVTWRSSPSATRAAGPA